MANFPSNYDTFSILVDNISDMRSSNINVVADAVTQIEKTLGINVQGANQGTSWTLANRLQRTMNEDGTLKPNALNPTAIPVDSVDSTKIYKDSTWSFQQVQVGKNANGSYGYTGTGPGANAGNTIADDGIIYNDGGFVTQGFIQTNGLTSTTQHIFGAPVNFQSNVFLGKDSTSVIEWTGVLRPSATVSFDLGDPTHRVNYIYAQNVIGTQAGGTTLVVSASASFGAGSQVFNIITTGTAPTGSVAASPFLYTDGTDITISASPTGVINFESPLALNGTTLFTSEGFNNWVENSKFDKWANGASALPNLWVAQGTLSANTRESSTVKYSPYALNLTTSSTNGGVSQTLSTDGGGFLPLELVKGQPFYYFADVYSASSGQVFLQLNDGYTLFDSDYLTTTSTYTRLVIQDTLSATASTVQVRVLAASSGISFKVGAVGFYQGQMPKAWAPHAADLAAYYG